MQNDDVCSGRGVDVLPEPRQVPTTHAANDAEAIDGLVQADPAGNRINAMKGALWKTGILTKRLVLCWLYFCLLFFT